MTTTTTSHSTTTAAETGSREPRRADRRAGGGDWRGGGRGTPEGSWQHGEYGGEAYGSGPEQYGRPEGFSGGRDYGGSQNYGGGRSQGQYRGGQSYAVGQGYGGGQDYSGGQYGRPNYSGKGPKGYTRSDERIREDVCDALMADHDLDASEIELDVKNGEVTLRGSVESREARRATEDLVESVAGVRNVQNSIRIDRRSEGMGESSGSQHRSSESDSSRTSKNR